MMKSYKIGVCCTFGAGSSLMLKMNLESTFSKMGFNASVEVYDISGISGVELDAIYTSSALAPQVASSVDGIVVVPVVNYFDQKELEELTQKYLSNL
jgi:galactitol-specific phosphotransferase system IIB component